MLLIPLAATAAALVAGLLQLRDAFSQGFPNRAAGRGVAGLTLIAAGLAIMFLFVVSPFSA